MKIDFSCPSCDRLLKAPVQATGHLLSCPACKEKILVPKYSNKNKEQNDTPAAACKSSTSDHDNQQNTAKIKFSCPSCDRLLNAPVQATGRLLSCPACKEKILVPKYSSKNKDTPAAACKSSTNDHSHNTIKIKFPCPSCNRLLNAPVQATGRLLSCPACKKQIRVPEYSDKKNEGNMLDAVDSNSIPRRVSDEKKMVKSLKTTIAKIQKNSLVI